MSADDDLFPHRKNKPDLLGNDEDTTGAIFHPSLMPDETSRIYLAYRTSARPHGISILPRNRSCCAMPSYSHFIDAFYDGEYGKDISIFFTYAIVKIKGNNLIDLAHKIGDRKVHFIQEYDPKRWDKPSEHEPIITSLEYKSRLDKDS